MRNQISVLLLILSFAVNPVQAQWIKSISIRSGYDDNAFRNFQSLSDYATQFSAYFARDISNERWQWRLFYRGSYNLFAEYDDRNNHYHQLGAAWSGILNEKNDAFNLGVNGKLRANRDAYDYYNFKEAVGYGNLKINLGSSSRTNFGYRLRGRWYSNLSELSYAEHYLFARYTHFFETRTTLIVEGNYGRKIYHDQILENTISQPDDGHYGDHRGGRGHFGTGSMTGENSPIAEKHNVTQLVAQLRVAQSLANSTGLSMDIRIRRNPGDGVRYLAGQVSGYTTEDELFDDRYGYESEEVATTLTQLLPWKMTLKSGLEFQWKDYVNRPALDLNGEVLSSGDLRNDRQVLGWLSLSKSFSVLGGKSVDLFAEFYWIDNQSNDLYYDYQVNLISFGITTSF